MLTKSILQLDIERYNIFSQNDKIMVRMCEQQCVEWETTEVCRDKEIWQTACVFGTVVCYTFAGGSCGPAVAVCTLVNRIVPECVSVPVCKRTEEFCTPGF